MYFALFLRISLWYNIIIAMKVLISTILRLNTYFYSHTQTHTNIVCLFQEINLGTFVGIALKLYTCFENNWQLSEYILKYLFIYSYLYNPLILSKKLIILFSVIGYWIHFLLYLYFSISYSILFTKNKAIIIQILKEL